MQSVTSSIRYKRFSVPEQECVSIDAEARQRLLVQLVRRDFVEAVARFEDGRVAGFVQNVDQPARVDRRCRVRLARLARSSARAGLRVEATQRRRCPETM